MAMATRGGGKAVKVTKLYGRHSTSEASKPIAEAPAARDVSSSVDAVWNSQLGFDPESDTVQLRAQNLAPPLPSLGEVEFVFREYCQHRIWRVDVRDSTAVVDVHPDDVSSCLAIQQICGQQVHVCLHEGGTHVAKRQRPLVASDGEDTQIQEDLTARDLPPKSHAQREKERKAEEERQRRAYRVGLSYRCGRCGKPKKGHVCDVPDGEEINTEPEPKLIAASTPVVMNAHHMTGSTCSSGGGCSTPGELRVTGEATTIFKDMVDALGENQAVLSANGTTPPGTAIGKGRMGSDSGPPSEGPHLSDMDMMLADLAFAARPPPVMTPHENEGEPLNEVPSHGLGSLTPSMISPTTMIQQLIATPVQPSASAANARNFVPASPSRRHTQGNPVGGPQEDKFHQL